MLFRSSPSLTLSEYVPPPAPATPSSTPSYTSPSGSSGINTRGLERAAKGLFPALYFADAANDVLRGDINSKTLNKLVGGFDIYGNADDILEAIRNNPVSGVGDVGGDLVRKSGDVLSGIGHALGLANGGVARFDDGGGVSDAALDRKSTRLNSSHRCRMPSSA